MTSDDKADLQVDVAIVGAGVAGAYVAYRLQDFYQSKGQSAALALFEYGNRVGGRLMSRTLPGMPHVYAELGGMRYIPATQALVANLIDQLGLLVKSFPMGSPNPKIGQNRNLLYLRRHHLRSEELSSSAKVPYRVHWSERDMSPSQLQTYLMNLLVPDAASLSLDDWFQLKVFGRELYQWGFWNLLYRVFSSEAADFMLDAGGYDIDLANANSVKTLPNIRGPEEEYKTLAGGFDQLPITMVDRFKASQGKFFPNWRLAGFSRRPASNGYRMDFVKTRTDESGNTEDDPDGRNLVVNAGRIVLAMPRRSLELVEWAGFHREPLRTNLASVILQPAFKLFLGYEYPWWKPLGLCAGRSITDLPIRQCYYFGTEGEQPGADKKNLNSLLMASYCSMHSVAFWKSFDNRDGPRFEGAAPSQFPVTDDMIVMAQRLLREVHDQEELPRPYTAICQDWGKDPFGAGFHSWKAGFRFNDVMKHMRQPFPDEAVHICGEAYSNAQGWVEGALQTAELVVEEQFGLPRPSWLPADYDLGP